MIDELYKDWFLDYASYVVLERAIPNGLDGLKPVQRRILHAMHNMHDGRFHKVANIIGQSMQFHPHGDAAIGDALVNLGQKDLLIDTQGNWGDPKTGDKAAAPRYIEARLSNFSNDILFNKKITSWKDSYDGRSKEPIQLPVKFPILLYQGVEGIAVGLSTKILPHNFIELTKACKKIIRGQNFSIFPDFINGGLIDVTNYNNGERGGKVKVRSMIEIINNDTLSISTVPYGITTASLIDSILKANDNGKLNIKNIEDNTAEDIDIVIKLKKGISPNVAIDALYAFTSCQVSISTNCCVIIGNKPLFISINSLLINIVDNIKKILILELQLEKSTIENRLHYSILERVFIEKKIYRDIESAKTWENVINNIKKGIERYKDLLFREYTDDDIIRLTELKIKRISSYDTARIDQAIKLLEVELDETLNNLNHIDEYAIRFFDKILNKYAKGKERKTEIQKFDMIKADMVALANEKLYVNRKDGFVGTSLKKEEFVSNCSILDSFITFCKDGSYIVSSVKDKMFIGKSILYVGLWKKKDLHNIYNLIYYDDKKGYYYAKRFAVDSIIKDRKYNISKGNEDNKIIYISANANSESELVQIKLHHKSKARNKKFDFDFSDVLIKSKTAKGIIVSKYKIFKIKHKEFGKSTLGGRDLWLDETIGRLNYNKQGQFLGSFENGDLILVIYFDGTYELVDFNLSKRYNMNEIVIIEKYNDERLITALYHDGESEKKYIKKFSIETKTENNKFKFITEHPKSKLILCTTDLNMKLLFNFWTRSDSKDNKVIDLDSFVSPKGWKSKGNLIGNFIRPSSFKLQRLNKNNDLESQRSLFDTVNN